MQPRPELQAWLVSGDRQAAGRRRTENARRWFEGLPSVAGFLRTLDRMDYPDPDGVVEALEALFAQTGWIELCISRWIDEAHRDPFFVPPFRPVSGAFTRSALMIERPEVSVALCALDPAALHARKRGGAVAGSVFFLGHRAVMRFLVGGRLQISWWRTAKLADGDDSGSVCLHSGVSGARDGDRHSLDMECESYIFERADGPAIFLLGEVKTGAAPLAREYDAGSGRLIGKSSGPESWSRVQMLLSYLRSSGRGVPEEIFDSFTKSAPHFVRWHAMREWIAADGAAALPRLAIMARDDPHIEVRIAAGRALAIIDNAARVTEVAQCRAT